MLPIWILSSKTLMMLLSKQWIQLPKMTSKVCYSSYDCVYPNFAIIEHNQLFYLTYEKVKVDESKLQAHLWTFRQHINLEHLKRVVQSKKIKIPVLDAFLQAVSSMSKINIDIFLYISSPYGLLLRNQVCVPLSTYLTL